jgi:N-acetylglucosaminyldiphosphoundecaprenol N-acetyl-beta-D-mannosaminyltransferase
MISNQEKIPNGVKVQVLSVPINLGTMDQHLQQICRWAEERRSTYTCFCNVHMAVEAGDDPKFRAVVENADMVTADGVPIKWAISIFHHIKTERVAGMDLLPLILKESEKRGLSVYFYGGTEEMLATTENHIATKFPALRVAGTCSPPFRPLTKSEETGIVDKINQSGANLLVVTLGCPKQEKWMASMRGRIHAAMIGIGGALPVMVGMQKRAPDWMQTAGLEWLHRLASEPGRLFKRYFVTNSSFLFQVARAYMKGQKTHRPGEGN